MELGLVYAALGAALASILPGIGSAIAVSWAGQAGAGYLTEEDNFGNILVLQALPATQGIYGLLIAFVLASKVGIIGGGHVMVTAEQGWQLLLGALPLAVVGLVSALFQGKASVASIHLIAKRGEKFGNALILPSMVETFAILALLVSFLMISGINVG